VNIKPYNETYLEDVESNVGSMFEYAANCEFDPIVIWDYFVNSKIAREIERGNPRYLSGYSGREYLDILINSSSNHLDKKLLDEEISEKNDMYYWAGNAVARLQYETCLTFIEIRMYLPMKEILDMYHILHEADLSKFVDIACKKIKERKPQTNLGIMRKAAGLSQQKLANLADVDLRSIQMYEQRKNDINKAQAITLFKLSKVLGCNVEDLLEKI
jgi:DNA-binding XRE family transcriptional regulator